MNIKLKKHVEDLHQIDNQRKGWLVLSAFVAVGVSGVIIGWDLIHQFHLIWLIVSVGLILTVSWWYWTMMLIRHLIRYKTTESEILHDIVEDIRYIKNNLVEPLDK